MSLSTPHEGYPLPGHEPKDVSLQKPLDDFIKKALKVAKVLKFWDGIHPTTKQDLYEFRQAAKVYEQSLETERRQASCDHQWFHDANCAGRVCKNCGLLEEDPEWVVARHASECAVGKHEAGVEIGDFTAPMAVCKHCRCYFNPRPT
jgi:hypothetical protein